MNRALAEAVQSLHAEGLNDIEIAARLGVGAVTAHTYRRRAGLPVVPRKEPSEAERFWRHVHPEPNSGCWLWSGAHTRGYGQMARPHEGSRLATHISLRLAGRPVPVGKIVCHHCDIPACVNPDHLFIGTHRDNSDDKREKGRATLPRPMPGSLHPKAVLSEESVRAVKRDLASGLQQKAIAGALGVSKSLINRIAVGKAWRHV